MPHDPKADDRMDEVHHASALWDEVCLRWREWEGGKRDDANTTLCVQFLQADALILIARLLERMLEE